MYICENCRNEHNGTYGSKRFCSKKCARGFSTKAKRKEINAVVSKKISAKGHKDVEKICPECGKIFKKHWDKRYIQTCSRKCGTVLKNKNPKYIENLSKKRIQKIIEGHVNNYGTKMIYNFNNEEIKCDSKIEYACLNYFDIKGATEMKRCKLVIEYKDNDKIRRFNPDFEIKLNEDTYIVEAKSYMCIKTVNEKWRNYNELSILKKEALKEFCNKMGYISFWFTKDLNLKSYKNVSVVL